MTPEKYSILLEIISFFLVSLDLIGKDRLAKIGPQIETSLRFFKERSKSDFISDVFFNKWYKNLLAFIFICFLILVILIPPFGGEILNYFVPAEQEYLFSEKWDNRIGGFLDHPVGYFLFSIIGSIVYGFSLIYVLITFIRLLIIPIIYLVKAPLDFIIKHILRLMNKKGVEGLFLLSGTILFLISKYVIW